jgi:hypothetical protein
MERLTGVYWAPRQSCCVYRRFMRCPMKALSVFGVVGYPSRLHATFRILCYICRSLNIFTVPQKQKPNEVISFARSREDADKDTLASTNLLREALSTQDCYSCKLQSKGIALLVGVDPNPFQILTFLTASAHKNPLVCTSNYRVYVAWGSCHPKRAVNGDLHARRR